MAGPVRKAVEANLRRLKALSSAEGQIALVLAERLDDERTPASAVAMSARELRELLLVLNEALKPREVSPLDEIRVRREERIAGAKGQRRSGRGASS